MSPNVKGRFAGWALVGWSALAIGAMSLSLLAFAGAGENGVRLVIRWTARTSLVLFSAAFGASSLHLLLHKGWTRRLLENRRYLGVSFAVSHAFHLAAIVALARVAPDSFAAEIDAVTLVLGGFGFVVVAALAATSFDATAAWLGPVAWRRLHRFGVWYLWFIFTATLLPGAFTSPIRLLGSVILVAAVSVRVAASLRSARRMPQPA